MTDIRGWTLILIVTIVFIVIIGVLIFFSFSRQAAITTRLCPPDLCAVSIINGTKRCPSVEGGQIERDNALEYCSSRNFCQSARFPCAILANGATDCSGECGEGNDECACIENALCPPFISSYFIRARDEAGNIEFISQASTYVDAFTQEETFTSGGAINLGSFNSPKGTCVISETELSLMNPRQCIIGKLANIKDTENHTCIYTDLTCSPGDILTVDTDGTVTCVTP